MEAGSVMVLSIQNGVNHGFMVRPNDTHKIETKGNGVTTGMFLFTYNDKQTFNRARKSLF
jgi:hypothetical protein